jgi:hypothetical protein
MGRSSPDRLRARRRSGAFAWFTAAIKLCLLLAAAQTAGLVHGAIDIATAVAGINDHDECPDEQNGRECPPGCPICHCSHGAVALPPVVATTFVDAFDPITTVTPSPTAAAVPRAPILPGVYRPPRVAPALV